MYKLILPFIFVAALSAEMVDGVAIVVKGSAITLYDIKKEMQSSRLNVEQASDVLIRKKLEEAEIQERRIDVTSDEVYSDIKQSAARNKLSVSEFYEAIRNSNGLSSTEFKEMIKEKLQRQKLYSSIAYSQVSQPSDSEIEDYYKLNKDTFSHPSSFKVDIYQSTSADRLQEKVSNPMLYSPDIQTNEQVLPYERISPEMASLLEKTPLSSFTPIVPDGKGGYMCFYIKEIESAEQNGIGSVKNQIINMIMAQKREQVLGDYFERLRHGEDIKTIRIPE